MSTEFALDLRVARRKAGFTQGDVAQLLGVHQKIVSNFERGQTLPSLKQICSLSLIFGRSFESLFAAVIDGTKEAIKLRLPALPARVRSHVGTFNRDSSLRQLEERLRDSHPVYGGAE